MTSPVDRVVTLIK